MYIKICKNLSAKYYQENKERLEQLVKDIKMFKKKIEQKTFNLEKFASY